MSLSMDSINHLSLFCFCVMIQDVSSRGLYMNCESRGLEYDGPLRLLATWTNYVPFNQDVERVELTENLLPMSIKHPSLPSSRK